MSEENHTENQVAVLENGALDQPGPFSVPTGALVEIMGYRKEVGQITEAVVFGQKFCRIEIPAINGRAGVEKFVGGASIYQITPLSEKAAMVRLESMYPRESYSLDLDRGHRWVADIEDTTCIDCTMPRIEFNETGEPCPVP